jgi:hypothetical protein
VNERLVNDWSNPWKNYWTSKCEACPDFTYQPLEGQTECLACPAGHSCSKDTACPKLCPEGTYSADGFSCIACAHCPGLTGLTTCEPGICQQNDKFKCSSTPLTFASKLVSSFFVRPS